MFAAPSDAWNTCHLITNLCQLTRIQGGGRMTFTSGSTLVAAAFAAALAFALRLLAVRLALVGLRARFGPFAGVYHAISEADEGVAPPYSLHTVPAVRCGVLTGRCWCATDDNAHHDGLKLVQEVRRCFSAYTASENCTLQWDH